MKGYLYYVYIMTSKCKGTLCTGMRSGLSVRVLQHKIGYFSGFIKKYKVNRLVFFEETNDVYAALVREKQIKKWKRA